MDLRPGTRPPNSIIWLFLGADEPSVHPPQDLAGAPHWVVSVCPDSRRPPDDSKIFLTVSYKYRYKLSCIVNVTGKFVNKLGKSMRRGEDYDVFFVNMRWKSC